MSRIKEYVKNIIAAALFISLSALVCVYIVRTQRLTLESPASLDIDRMLTLRSGDDSFISGFSAERVLPECVAVKSGGAGRAAMGGRSIISGAVSLLSEPLESLFGGEAEISEIPEEDSAAVWRSCCAASDSVYIRFRSPLPAPVLRMYISGGTDIDSVAGLNATGDVYYISELFILPGDKTEEASGTRFFRAAARDGDGVVLRIDSEVFVIDMDAAVSYSQNSEFSDFVFAGDEAAAKPDLKISPEPSAPETFGEAPRLFASFKTGAAAEPKKSPEALLKLFGYNTGRLIGYDEPDTGASVYVETWGTLKITNDSILFAASGERGGIGVSKWLPYGRTGGAYTIYELLYCSENLISGLAAVSPGLAGGDSQLCLHDIYLDEDGCINIDYRYIFDGIDIAVEDRGIGVTVKDGMIRTVSVRPLTAVNQLTRQLNFSMERALGGRASLAASGEGGRVRLMYFPDLETESPVSAQWAYCVSENSIIRTSAADDTDETEETAQTDETDETEIPTETEDTDEIETPPETADTVETEVPIETADTEETEISIETAAADETEEPTETADPNGGAE